MGDSPRARIVSRRLSLFVLSLFMLHLEPFIGSTLGLFLRDPVSLLYLADKLVAPPRDLIQIIVGELSPFFLG